MELRRFSVCLAFLLVAVVSHCSEARHSLKRRDANYDDFQSDGFTDTEQNDADNQGEDEGDSMPNATILTRPQTYTPVAGDTVRLECRIDIKDTVVDWSKDGKAIVKTDFIVDPSLNDKYTFTRSENSDLTIKNVEPSDSGRYRCRLNQGLPMQVEHNVVITGPPKVLSISASDDGRPKEGATLQLQCNVDGVPAPEIIWSVAVDVDGRNQNRKLTEKDGQFTRNSVTISNVNREHSGTYYCYAINKLGNDTKGTEVSVQSKPHIHVHRTVVNSAVNVEATLQCAVHEDTPVVISWYKNDQPITSASNTRITTSGNQSNLTVIPASDTDFGTYTCSASSSVGVHSKSIELVQRPVVEELNADGTKLNFRVHSHQKLEDIEVQLKPLTEEGDWKKLHVDLPSTQNHEYDLSYVVQEDLKPGRYEVVVKVKNNKAWSHASDATFLNIVEQPIIQGASVYRGNDAVANRPATVLVSTVLMYLLVRML